MTRDERLLVDVVVDGEVLDVPAVGEPLAAVALEQRNLFAEAERLAARAATAGTRRQYASIYRAFGDWCLRSQKPRKPASQRSTSCSGSASTA